MPLKQFLIDEDTRDQEKRRSKSFYFFKNELKELAFLVRTMHTGMHVGEVALQNSSWIKGTSNSKNISNSRRVNSDTTSH